MIRHENKGMHTACVSRGRLGEDIVVTLEVPGVSEAIGLVMATLDDVQRVTWRADSGNSRHAQVTKAKLGGRQGAIKKTGTVPGL